jgi:hypothetical protein
MDVVAMAVAAYSKRVAQDEGHVKLHVVSMRVTLGCAFDTAHGHFPKMTSGDRSGT